MTLLGIDHGTNGAIAYWVDQVINQRTRRRYRTVKVNCNSVFYVLDTIEAIKEEVHVEKAYVESVYLGSNVKTHAALSAAKSNVIQACNKAGILVDIVAAVTWQTMLNQGGCRPQGRDAIKRASSLHARTMTNDRISQDEADALCILWWAGRHEKQLAFEREHAPKQLTLFNARVGVKRDVKKACSEKVIISRDKECVRINQEFKKSQGGGK